MPFHRKKLDTPIPTLTDALGFRRMLRLRRPRILAMPFVNLAVVVGLVFAQHSLLVYGGLGIGLPTAANDIHLQGESTSAVLTLRGEGVLLFDGRICTRESLPALLHRYRQNHPGVPPTLLLEADAAVDSQTLVDICLAARKAGFANAVLAAESAKPAGGR